MILGRVVKELQTEHNRLEKELERVNAALNALGNLNSRRRGRKPGVSARTGRPRRTLSAAARRRIAAAQKARWAKVREQRQKRAA